MGTEKVLRGWRRKCRACAYYASLTSARRLAGRLKAGQICAAVVSVTAFILVCLQRPEGFYLGLAGNALWMWFSWRLGMNWMFAMFAVYEASTILGIYWWRR